MIQYCDIFNEARQRATAFLYWEELYGDKSDYGKLDEWSYLEQAYRFLFSSATVDFLRFCAKKEGIEFHEYCADLGIDEGDLLK